MKEQQKHFKKNLRLLRKFHAPLAYQLTMTDPSDLEFCQTRQGELNLKRSYENQIYYYHSPLNAFQESHDWFQSIDLHVATVILVYGIGLGYYYQAAQPWLKQNPHHALVFLEEDLGVLHRLFETELGSTLLKDPQVKIIDIQNSLTDKSIFHELSWTYFESPFVMSCLKLYEQVNPDGYVQLQHQLSYYFVQKKRFVKEYLQYGAIFFRNFYPNLFEIPHAYWGNGLFDCFSQVPAIICGAGPSLNKNIDLLPYLKERALLFAGGSALNALIPKKIIPHFGVAIDPHQEQYPRVTVTQPYHVPFFYRNRLFHEALTAMTGSRLYLTGSGGYETARWFEKKLHIEGNDLDEGHNVVNFSLQIAKALGCNPIILIGVDLAFTDQHYYADGIIANLNLTQEDLNIEDNPDSRPLLKEDMHGKPIYTLWKWITEAEWISQFAELHPEITILNATEGGLGFKGIPNLSLQEAAQQFLTNPQDSIKYIDQEIQKHSLRSIHPDHILELLLEMKASLDHCGILFSRLIETGDQLAKSIKHGHSFPADLQTLATSLLENEIEEEIGYQFLLDIFNKVYLRLHHRNIQDIQSRKRRLSKKRRALKQLEIERQRLIFLRDVAHFNRDLIQHVVKKHSSIKDYKKPSKLRF
jgi:hypothetical protein